VIFDLVRYLRYIVGQAGPVRLVFLHGVTDIGCIQSSDNALFIKIDERWKEENKSMMYESRQHVGVFGGTTNLTSSGVPNVILCQATQMTIRPNWQAAAAWPMSCYPASVGVILIASSLAGLAMKPDESASASSLAGLISFAICLASLSKRDIKSPVQYDTVQRHSMKLASCHETIVPTFWKKR